MAGDETYVYHYSVTVFCGASFGNRPIYRQAVAEFGRLVGGAGFAVVYGGASVGLMGTVADEVLRSGGKMTGVVPRDFVRHEITHSTLTELHIVDDMHKRKALMAELGDAFVALPGGFGTAEELFEVLTWSQLGLHHKPCFLLDVNRFFQPLLTFLAHTVDEGFLHPDHLKRIAVYEHPAQVFEQLMEHARSSPNLSHSLTLLG